MFPLRPLEPEQINLTSKLIRFIITAARLKKTQVRKYEKNFSLSNRKTWMSSLNKKENESSTIRQIIPDSLNAEKCQFTFYPFSLL